MRIGSMATGPMKIAADENIPYVRALFEPLGQVVTLPGRSIAQEHLIDADILLVRSVTPVNRSLLEKTNIQFVGTCTIGVDHLDTEYLKSRNIRYTSAPGCNANAVVQYVVSAITYLCRQPSSCGNVVVVGGGNVGRRVYAALSNLGFNCSCVDPFIDPATTDMRLTVFDAIFDADIVCFHTPLTIGGEHPTYHLLNEQNLTKLKPGMLLLNAGRGAVIDNNELLKALNSGCEYDVVLDVWDTEPSINVELLKKVALGTPHIAGYSFEGRLMGSLMIFDALCEFLNRDESVLRDKVVQEAYGEPKSLVANNIKDAIASVYAINKDFEDLRNAVEGLPSSFDALRKHYPQRREFSHFTLPYNIEDKQKLLALGFKSE